MSNRPVTVMDRLPVRKISSTPVQPSRPSSISSENNPIVTNKHDWNDYSIQDPDTKNRNQIEFTTKRNDMAPTRNPLTDRSGLIKTDSRLVSDRTTPRTHLNPAINNINTSYSGQSRFEDAITPGIERSPSRSNSKEPLFHHQQSLQLQAQAQQSSDQQQISSFHPLSNLPYNQSLGLSVEIEDPLPVSSPFLEPSLSSTNGPRLRKSSFTFDEIDEQESNRFSTPAMECAEVSRTERGSPGYEIELNERGKKRRMDRPSTGTSTIERLTMRSGSLGSDLRARPFLGRLSRKLSEIGLGGKEECESVKMDELKGGEASTQNSRKGSASGSGSGKREKLFPELYGEVLDSPPLEFPAQTPASASKEHLRLEIITKGGNDISPSPTRNDQLHRTGSHPNTYPGEDFTPLSMRGKYPSTAGRDKRRDSATKEARMELAVNAMMGTKRTSTLSPRLQETDEGRKRLVRRASEMGELKAQSVLTDTGGRNSIACPERGEVLGTERARALSDIAATPPISPINTKNDKPFEFKPESARPSPLYTFPPKAENLENRNENQDLPPLLVAAPVKVIKQKRSGFMNFLREKMTLRSPIQNEVGSPDEERLSDSQRIQQAYLLTSERDEILRTDSPVINHNRVGPKRAVSQFVAPPKVRSSVTGGKKPRPTSMLVATPPRPIGMTASHSSQSLGAKEKGAGLAALEFTVDPKKTVPVIAMKSQNPLPTLGALGDEKARIRELELELTHTKSAWHSQIKDLEDQLEGLKRAVVAAKQDTVALIEKSQGGCSRCGCYCAAQRDLDREPRNGGSLNI